MKKILAIILAIVSIMSYFSAMAVAEEDVFLATCGMNVEGKKMPTAYLNGTMLVVRGEGWARLDNPSIKSKYDIITDVVIEEGITEICEISGLQNLRSVTLPDSLTTLSYRCFKDCINLNEINLGNGMYLIWHECFLNTAYYNDESNWENGALYIDNYLFYGDGIKSATYEVKSGTIAIAADVFKNNTNLTDIILPDGLLGIGPSGFYGCTGFESVLLPDSILNLGNASFMYCTNLKHINIPMSMNVLGWQVFSCCYSLQEIHIPASIYEISSDISTFSKMYSIQNISVDENNEHFYVKGNCLIEKSTGKIVLGCVNSVIPEDPSVTMIGADAFSGAKITSISIPENIKAIGSCAFYNCNALKKVYVPKTVVSLASGTFEECKCLEEVILDCDIDTLPGSIFYGCRRLSKISLPCDIKEIQNAAFHSCTGLCYINIPSSLKTIGAYAFGDCYNLKDIYFNGSKNTWSEINQSTGVFNEIEGYLIHYNSTKETHETHKRNTATCTQSGEIEYYCDCGYVLKTETLSATGHSYTATTVTPTCITKGYTHYVCSSCGNTYDDNIAKELGHNYMSTITNPTCISDGYTTYTCSECSDTYIDDYTSAYNHNYKTAITFPTCTSQGYTTYTCVNCGDSYVADYTDKTEHTTITINEKDATYDGTGYTGDVYCTSCNSIIEYGKEIPKLEKEKKSLSWIVGHIANFIIKVFGYLRGFNLI